MSEEKVIDELAIVTRPLISKKDGGYFVLVSHAELDHLIGRLMQLCDLTGDLEQRQALKQEIKWRIRSWLDEAYADAGYKHHALLQGVKPIEI